MPPIRRRLLPLLVVLAILLAGTMEVAARTRELDGFGKAVSQTRIIQADETYNQTFEWHATYMRLPSPFSEPVVLLGLEVAFAVDAPSSAQSESPLRVEVTVFLNGDEDERMTFTMGVGHGGVRGGLPGLHADHAWRYGENDIRVVAHVVHTPIPGATGTYELTLGPLELDRKR